MATAILPFLAVLLTALLMGTTLAHAPEMPAKMNASATQWLALQQSLYRSFATIGGPIEIAAIGWREHWRSSSDHGLGDENRQAMARKDVTPPGRGSAIRISQC
jgi:hypothetical protein